MSEKMTDINTHQWAIIELMGHQKIAGRYSEQGPMHRIDVPDNDGGFRFTRLYSPQAIYSITFVDQETANAAAKVFDQPAITIWELQREIRRLAATASPNEVINSGGACLNCGGQCDGDFCSIDCQYEYTENE